MRARPRAQPSSSAAENQKLILRRWLHRASRNGVGAGFPTEHRPHREIDLERGVRPRFSDQPQRLAAFIALCEILPAGIPEMPRQVRAPVVRDQSFTDRAVETFERAGHLPAPVAPPLNDDRFPEAATP